MKHVQIKRRNDEQQISAVWKLKKIVEKEFGW